jgi:GMP synthase (glutamine-hydrolysing)
LLPDPTEVGGVLVMGGPMNVDRTDLHPALVNERDWLAAVVSRGTPVLGICLGAQLLARALGAPVSVGERAEIGFAPIEVFDPSDPIIGGLFPRTEVLHWHSDLIELPAGAQRLASSAMTENQAFRHGNAWGILFHPEADRALIDTWLSVPQMKAQATEALGEEGLRALPGIARSLEQELVRCSTPGFLAFAELVSGSSTAEAGLPGS